MIRHRLSAETGDIVLVSERDCWDCLRPLPMVRYRFRASMVEIPSGPVVGDTFVLVDVLCPIARMKRGERCA